MKATLHFDGGYDHDSRRGAGAAVIITPQGTAHRSFFYAKETCISSNVAEYLSLINGLKWVDEKSNLVTELEVIGDSKLVVNQVNNEWECRAEHLRKYVQEAFSLIVRLRKRMKVELRWVRREKNEVADELVRAEFAKHGIVVKKPSDFDGVKKEIRKVCFDALGQKLSCGCAAHFQKIMQLLDDSQDKAKPSDDSG